MRYSIVTPSILRSTLARLCQSLDTQTCQDFEHIVIVDIPLRELTPDQLVYVGRMNHSNNRKFYFCDQRHMNTGNTCRHNATKIAQGDYIYYIDDDDLFADDRVLETLRQVTADWAIFPVNVCGRSFYSDPPGMCRTTTGGFLLKRGLIDWPDVKNYETDGMIVDELMRRGVPYQTITERCMALHPVWNVGKYI